MGDEAMDFFVFFGEPKDILNEYTEIVGKPGMPPLWSFGTWMSRITYFSQKDGYDVATNLRKHKIPSDVIHFDTGWFETDWQCDYQFAPNRFSDPQQMLDDLKKQGFHTCLWQLPYFTPKNRFFNELIEKDLYVKNAKGELPYEDVVTRFLQPAIPLNGIRINWRPELKWGRCHQGRFWRSGSVDGCMLQKSRLL